MFRFEGLEAWQLAVEHGKDCYQITSKFPKHETYALSDQLRRAAVSVPGNIAEGSVGSSAMFGRYIVAAIESTLGTVNILHFAFEMGYINKETETQTHEDAEKVIHKLRSFLRALRD